MIRELKRLIKKQIDPISPLALDIMPQTNIVADIDVWDKGSSTKNIDEIAEAIESRLDRLRINDEGISIAVYHISTHNVVDSDSSIRRKTCTLEMQVRKG